MERRQQKQTGPFQCTACGGTYTRVDHLARHVRSHLQERPFKCEVCSKAFGRPDLLKRHRGCHDDDAGRPSKRQYNSTSRVSQACRLCAAAKIKCDDHKPCSRCSQRGVVCEYASDLHEDTRSKTSEADVLPVSAAEFARDSPQYTAPAESAEMAMAPTDTRAVNPPLPPPDMQMPPMLDPLVQDMSGFLREVMMPAYAHPNLLPIDHTVPSGLLDFRVDADFALDDTDYGFLDQLCGDLLSADVIAAPLPEPPPQPSPPPHAPSATAAVVPHRPPDASGPGATTRQNIALGAEAFRRSALGVWLPAQQDRTDAQMEHLSILTDAAGSPDTRINIDRRCLREPLNRTTRDELLAMILRTCGAARASFVVRSFPTAELLGDLAECFFVHHEQQADAFVHAPTFRPNGQRPELLGAIVACGATTADMRAIRKLGYAMQEAVRTTLVGTCEDANAATREMWLLQAFLCELRIGLWSGIKRKMEIAESHTQTVLTMLRRAGRFQRLPPRTAALAAAPLPQDAGDVLQHKWRAWCTQESFRRMAFHAFICDAQVSISMQTTPILSYAEMALPFAASRDLWTAETAEQWKTLYRGRARADSPHLSLIDVLQQPAELPDGCDVPLATLVVLFGLWGMISHHLQLVRVERHRSGTSSAGGRGEHRPAGAANTLRHQELLQMLQHVRMNMAESPQPLGPETGLVLELLHVNMHCNFADLQLFAGRGDVEDARRVLPDLQQWVAGREARAAVWHAGQVLRAAAAFPVKQLRDFYTVAVYHAGLTLWAYGVIAQRTASSMQTTTTQNTQSTQDHRASVSSTSSAVPQMLFLDGPESQAVQRFVALGKGTPCIGQCATAGTPLSDPEGVMDTVVQVLEANFATKGSPDTDMQESLSPLVENLVQLMKGLGRAAGNVSS